MKRPPTTKPAPQSRASTGKRTAPKSDKHRSQRKTQAGTKISAPLRMYSPFRLREIDATPEQARISRQVWKTMDLYKAAKADLARRARQEWRSKPKRSLLGELEMLESTISGVASWCEGVRTHPDPVGATKRMFFYDIPAISRKLRGYPQLQNLLLADMKLREMVAEFLERHRLDQPR